MRTFSTLILMSLWTINIFSQTTGFKHDWEIKYLEHSIQFTSKKQAPKPFSETGEAQAMMFFNITELDSTSKETLAQIVKKEMEDIRKTLTIEEYLEEDYKAKDNVVLYFDTINNVQTGVIKYRTSGEKQVKKTKTRSVRHILFIYNHKLYISSLVVLFGEDQENMRSDQMTFIEGVINKK